MGHAWVLASLILQQAAADSLAPASLVPNMLGL